MKKLQNKYARHTNTHVNTQLGTNVSETFLKGIIVFKEDRCQCPVSQREISMINPMSYFSVPSKVAVDHHKRRFRCVTKHKLPSRMIPVVEV